MRGLRGMRTVLCGEKHGGKNGQGYQGSTEKGGGFDRSPSLHTKIQPQDHCGEVWRFRHEQRGAAKKRDQGCDPA